MWSSISSTPTATFLVTTTTDASGNYSVQLPGVLSNGTITLYARSRDLANNIGPTSAAFVLTIDTIAAAPATPVLQAPSGTGRRTSPASGTRSSPSPGSRPVRP